MFYDKDIEIWRRGDKIVENGVNLGFLPATLVNTDTVDIQPYSSAEAKMDYGYDIKTTHVMFIDVRELFIGTHIIKYKGNNYEIREIIEWDDYMEVLLERI